MSQSAPGNDREPPVRGELVEGWPPPRSRRSTSSPVDELRELLPAVGRLTAAASIRSAVWGIEAGARVGTSAVRVAVPSEALELLSDLGAALREYARELLGVTELDRRTRKLLPHDDIAAGGEPAGALRARGAELLRRSAEIEESEGVHPAYAHILTELAPDEARILRLLARDGPQPTIDVRAANLIGVGSQLVAQGVNMMGTEAGCQHSDRVPAYLNNLARLGRSWFSPDPLDDPGLYQVLEAQPEATEAIKSAGRARTTQRSVRLTAFGKDFCDMCLPVDDQVV
jgi:hypothetical protein